MGALAERATWRTFRELGQGDHACAWTVPGRRLKQSLVATEGVPTNGLWYFGDIDTAGFRIARMAASRAEKLAIGELRPAVALYRVCCDAGTIRTTANRAAEELQRWTRDWFGGTLGRVTAEIIADGGRIVQETVGVELLNSVETDRLLPE